MLPLLEVIDYSMSEHEFENMNLESEAGRIRNE